MDNIKYNVNNVRDMAKQFDEFAGNLAKLSKEVEKGKNLGEMQSSTDVLVTTLLNTAKTMGSLMAATSKALIITADNISGADESLGGQ